ncbi:MAG TPA: CBS domain-containing protein [Thermoanaerobaculia bacterium]|nr:CBS domain-containing protein [Thermoanaerobaculia bacterium]
MAGSIPNLRVLDSASSGGGKDLASELFHRINRVLPQNQSVLTVPPSCLVRDAVILMRKHGYSQVPVVDNGEVLGVFSFRSFAFDAASQTSEEVKAQKCAPGDLTVDDFLEDFAFARVTDEWSRFFDAMDKDNGVLVGTPERLIGILTPMDFLHYLFQVAAPYVLISEIELALRALISAAMSADQIEMAAQRCLSGVYEPGRVPTSVEKMTFDNYKTLISNGEAWESLESVFGPPKTRTVAKLKEIGTIRNDLFHFKREITLQDHQVLTLHRNWLLVKVKLTNSRKRSEQS